MGAFSPPGPNTTGYGYGTQPPANSRAPWKPARMASMSRPWPSAPEGTCSPSAAAGCCSCGANNRSHHDPTQRSNIRARRISLTYFISKHVLQVAARLVAALLEQCLDVAGEFVLPVPPLGLPERPGPRGRRVRGRQPVHSPRPRAPGFEPTAHNSAAIAGLCTRLDGMPLGIELA